jgi:hypothetical protein
MSMPDDRRPRIIDVTRKPSKCPDCGSEVVDIVYGTGDMTESDFLFEYRKSAIMGGNNIPRRPPIWCCACGCKRFRKINEDGTDAPVKVKMLKNIRKAPASKITWSSSMIETALDNKDLYTIHNYSANVVTELGEQETLSLTAISIDDAKELAMRLLSDGFIGLKGRICEKIEVKEN